MPSTTNYYEELKLKLDAQALQKKNALDVAYERATTVTFDANGNPVRKKDDQGKDKGPGTLDVQYAEQQRQISAGAESSGTLRSGEYGRDLATSLAGYRTAVTNAEADTTSGKTAIDNESSSELAKYAAMYGDSTTTNNTTTTGNGAAGGGNKDIKTDDTITEPDKFDPYKGKLVKVPNTPRKDTSGRSGMGATKKPPAVVKKPVPTKVPVPNKIKTLRPGF